MAAIDLDAAIGADSLAGLAVSRERGFGAGITAASMVAVPVSRERGLTGGFAAGSGVVLDMDDNDWTTCDIVASSSTSFSYMMVRPRPPARMPPPPRQALRQVPQPIREPRLTIKLPE